MWDAIKRLVVRGTPRSASPPRSAPTSASATSPAMPAPTSCALAKSATTSPPAVPRPSISSGPSNRIQRASRIPRPATDDARCRRQIKQRLLDEALAMLDEDHRNLPSDRRAWRSKLLEALAGGSSVHQRPHPLQRRRAWRPSQYGTALAPIYVGAEQGVHVPRLRRRNPPAAPGQPHHRVRAPAERHPVTVICDNMAAR